MLRFRLLDILELPEAHGDTRRGIAAIDGIRRVRPALRAASTRDCARFRASSRLSMCRESGRKKRITRFRPVPKRTHAEVRRTFTSQVRKMPSCQIAISRNRQQVEPRRAPPSRDVDRSGGRSPARRLRQSRRWQGSRCAAPRAPGVTAHRAWPPPPQPPMAAIMIAAIGVEPVFQRFSAAATASSDRPSASMTSSSPSGISATRVQEQDGRAPRRSAPRSGAASRATPRAAPRPPAGRA